MNLSRTAVMLVAVLVVLICVSGYLWWFVGLGSPEVDPRVGSLRQSFTCDQCGHVFTMAMKDVTRMLRSRGQIHCPKCKAGGARKDIGPPMPGQDKPAATQSSQRPDDPAPRPIARSAASQPGDGAAQSPPAGRPTAKVADASAL